MTQSTAWPARRGPMPLSAGQLHVWSVDLDGLLAEADACRALLAPDESERASRFHFERDARRYVVGRGVLRRLLAAYLGAPDPSAVVLAYGAHGKPELVATPKTDGGLRFNVAHTGGFALMGFAHGVDVGIDVEHVHRITDMAGVMRVSFASAERERISALGASEQPSAFFRCWTRKEAVLKALGWGLAKPLDSFEVSIAEHGPRLLTMSGEARGIDEWKLVHLIPAAGYIGAAAWDGPALTVECFSYDA